MPATLTSAPVRPGISPLPGTQFFSHDLDQRALFADHFDTSPFQFRHNLDQEELFQIPALLDAAERMVRRNDHKSHFESGEPDKNAWFGSRPTGKTMIDALAEIKSGKNWVVLKRIHEDPAYGAVLTALIPELSSLTGMDFAKVYYDPTMTIFVTSPGRITPYHMDGETNFLAQVRGPKEVSIYNGRDSSVLSQVDMERYWTGKLPKIDYPAHLPHGHWRYELQPGSGVFNPTAFPHWLQNGPEVSVSVSINFKRRRDVAVGAHRTNKYLRMMGLRPASIGLHPRIDQLKNATFGRAYAWVKGAAETVK